MVASSDTVPSPARWPVAGDTYLDAALFEAIGGMQPSWIVFRTSALAGGGQEFRARVRYASLHPESGVALLDTIPGSTILNAPDRLRRSLEAADIQGRFRRPPAHRPALHAFAQPS